MGALRDELAELLGPEGLRALSKARGGRRARIPKTVPPGHWLERAVGAELAERLAFRYGGCRIYIHMPGGRDPRETRQAVLELRSRGWSVSRIAEAVGVSDRTVWRAISRADTVSLP